MAFPASLALSNVRLESAHLVSPAFAAGDGGDQKTSLEQRFAEFALSIKYDDLPQDVVASAKRVRFEDRENRIRRNRVRAGRQDFRSLSAADFRSWRRAVHCQGFSA
ncbi:hypothetical protein XH88_09970 [Bradyrhizobium sp. CCBAU 51627]|nr:hypothetical protein [Bradyrhizobium sp. CCBAU 51627]